MSIAATIPIKPVYAIPSPRNCSFDPHDWQVLAQYWHPAAFSSEVGSAKPFAAVLLDEELVLFRSEGKVVAARDVCPHCGAPLSLGWVDGGNVVCPYHGLQYGADGAASTYLRKDRATSRSACGC